MAQPPDAHYDDIDVTLPDGLELAALAEHGGAFDWLWAEPDLYSLDDGEPVDAE